MSVERQKRIGANEALYRQVNERIRDLNETFATFSDRIEIMCECGSRECSTRISMTAESYEQLRADPTLFAVVPGHEAPDVEDVIAKGNTYDLVRKHDGLPVRIAEATDPRS